jgi:hypothetical protein
VQRIARSVSAAVAAFFLAYSTKVAVPAGESL